MISIVFVGRNDNYGGNFEERLLSTTRNNFAEFERRGIDAELVFVEWNPIEDEPLLSLKVAEAIPRARCLVVDGALHDLISENRFIKVYEFHAKNIGVRHARGDLLLLSNPDNFYGDDILDFLQRGEFDPQTFYRAGWIDIETAADVNRADMNDHFAWNRPPYTGASGDFVLCAKTLFDRVDGYREDILFSNTHVDGILVQAFYDITKRVSKIGHTYHLTHGREQQAKRRVKFEWKQVDRTPQRTYGFDSLLLETPLAPRITRLSLPDPLAREARARAPVDPRVPAVYRPAPPGLRMLKRNFLQARYAISRLLNARPSAEER